MTNTEIQAKELANELAAICKNAKIEIKPTDDDICVLVHNPNGGHAIEIFTNDFDKELKVVYRKTPRFFPDDPKGNAELLKAVGDYISGKIIYLDITSSSNQDYPRDRLVNIDELPAEPDFEQLARLCIDKNLLSESELRFELQAGSTIGVHFWDTSKNFSYKMQGSKIVKF